MMKKSDWFVFLALACASIAWACWCWHDPVNGAWYNSAPHRAPTLADRVALLLFAAARIAGAFGLLLENGDK